jgi:hypothetical protein
MAKQERKKRIPVSGSQRNILTVENKDDKNFNYRWVNMDEQRIARFLDACYEFERRDEVGEVGDRKVDSSSGTSSLVEKGVGGGKKAVLMKQPIEFYKEDQAAKQHDVDERETAMKQNALSGRYGKLEISRGPLSQGS